MSSRLTKDFVKLRHRSRVFTASNVAALQIALDNNDTTFSLNDMVSVVFLMCGNDQIEDMYKIFSSTNFTGVGSVFSILQTFPEWEQKLPQALGAIRNELALLKLGISQKDLQYNRMIKDSELSLCPVRVALYKIIDELSVQDGKRFISKMVELGAPQPPEFPHFTKLTHVELLYFMYWHSQGFMDIQRREDLEIITQSLKSVERDDLASYFIPPLVFQDGYVFDDHHLEVYEIKNPKNPGLCVIINQVRYGGDKRDRQSSVFNVNELVSLMKTLNFTVVAIEDLPQPGFCDRIKTTVESSFSEGHSVFMLIIMGHGEPEGVLCPSGKVPSKDGSNLLPRLEVVRIEDIQHSLFECRQLETIPKVLVINACRGSGEFTTRDYFRMVADGPDRSEALLHMDLITCYSALPNFVSWRAGEGKGSLFINLFCEILMKRPDIEICELFTLMNARLMQPTADMSVAFTPGHIGYQKRIGLPFDFTSSLRKKLHCRLPETCSTL